MQVGECLGTKTGVAHNLYTVQWFFMTYIEGTIQRAINQVLDLNAF